MLKPFIAAVMTLTIVEAAPFPIQEQTAIEIDRLISKDQRSRFDAMYEKVCQVKATLISEELSQRERNILALQTSLSFGNTGPEISHQLRQSAIHRWNSQQCSPLVKQAVLKMLTYGIRPSNGYATHYFERDYLHDLSFQERTDLKKEFEQAIALFCPSITKQLEHQWLKRLPRYEDVDAAVYEAGLDHQAALDVYAALLGHHIYGWITSGFGGDPSTFAKISMPAELNDTHKQWLKSLYIEASQLENNWHYRINDRDYRNSRPTYFSRAETEQYQKDAEKLANTFRHLPSDIRPEIVVSSANVYNEHLSKTVGNINIFNSDVDRTLSALIESLFNQDILSDYKRFAGIQLGTQFYDQIKSSTHQLGMIPVIESNAILAFRRAQLPEKEALIHAAAIRNTPQIAYLIDAHYNESIGNLPYEKIAACLRSPCASTKSSDYTLALVSLAKQTIPAPAGEQASIKKVADLGKYLTVVDNTILTRRYPRKNLFDLRHQLLMLSFHPKANEVNFDINPEFRASLEKLFSRASLDEFQVGLLEDHMHRLEQMCDRHIGYDAELLAHSAFYREKFILEAYPEIVPTSNSYIDGYDEIRRFLVDGQRVFRRLQQLEIEVMTESRDASVSLYKALMAVLSKWENENGYDHLGTLPRRVQWNLVLREVKDRAELQGDKLKNINRDSFDVMHASNFTSSDYLMRIVREYAPGLQVVYNQGPS